MCREECMNLLAPVTSPDDIFPQYCDTPVGRLLEYHNLGFPFSTYEHAQILIGMCMDNRKSLRIPERFAYILRTGGGNLRYFDFKISYAVTMGGIKAIALLGHNNCGMVNLASKREQFVNGLVQVAGWDRKEAENHFMSFAPLFEIDDEISFTLSEARRLRGRYPKIIVAPLFYRMEDNRLYQLIE